MNLRERVGEREEEQVRVVALHRPVPTDASAAKISWSLVVITPLGVPVVPLV